MPGTRMEIMVSNSNRKSDRLMDGLESIVWSSSAVSSPSRRFKSWSTEVSLWDYKKHRVIFVSWSLSVAGGPYTYHCVGNSAILPEKWCDYRCVDPRDVLMMSCLIHVQLLADVDIVGEHSRAPVLDHFQHSEPSESNAGRAA